MKDLVDFYKEGAVGGMDEFLKVFSFVPDNKLNWSPTPTAKSALRIGAHTALYAARFARMIREVKLPRHDNLEEWLARRNAEEIAVTSREEVEAIFRKGTAEVVAALDSLTPEAVSSTLDSGFGWSVPMTWLMRLPEGHAVGHAGQIDYLQTCWDDQEVHF